MAYLWRALMLVSVCTILSVNGFPGGAPMRSCRSRMPYHRSADEVYFPQNSPSPFTVSVNVTEFRPGDMFSVTIRSTVEGLAFRGFLLQARAVVTDEDDFRDRSLGRFHNLGSNSKPLTCDVALESVTHTDAFAKYKLTLDWRSPLLIKNDLVMIATFVTNFTTFWVDVKSPVIKLVREGPLPAEGLETPWLKEMIKTSNVELDKKATRELVKARFEKGFRGAIDPNGFIMVHYVLDVLPFEVSLPPKLMPDGTTPVNSTTVTMPSSTDVTIVTTPMTPPGSSSSSNNNTTNMTVTTSQPQAGDDNSDTPNTLPSIDNQSIPIPTATQSVLSNDTKTHIDNVPQDKDDGHYKNLVKTFLKGDTSVIDDLTAIIQKMEEGKPIDNA